MNFDPDAILASIPWIGAVVRGDSRGGPKVTRFIEQAFPARVVGIILISYQGQYNDSDGLKKEVAALRVSSIEKAAELKAAISAAAAASAAGQSQNSAAIEQFKIRHDYLAAQITALNIKTGIQQQNQPTQAMWRD